jgi:hypothetical protein
MHNGFKAVNDEFFISEKWWVSGRCGIAGASTALVLLVPTIPILLASDTFRKFDGDLCSEQYSAILLGLYMLVYLFLFAYLWWNLRDVFDAFGIKEELKYTAIVTCIGLVPWLFSQFISHWNHVAIHVYPYPSVIILCIVTAMFVLSIQMPLYSSIFFDQSVRSS